jgi:hypothetical protein
MVQGGHFKPLRFLAKVRLSLARSQQSGGLLSVSSSSLQSFAHSAPRVVFDYGPRFWKRSLVSFVPISPELGGPDQGD